MKNIEIQLSRNIQGSNLLLKVSVDESSKVSDAITELTEQLNKLSGIEQVASITPAEVTQFPMGINPAPALDESISSMPILENPPQSYKPAEAVVAILDPKKSQWGRELHTVKEVQQRLLDLGVRGIANLQSIDSYMRKLVKQGKLRREKDGSTYKYYVPRGE